MVLIVHLLIQSATDLGHVHASFPETRIAPHISYPITREAMAQHTTKASIQFQASLKYDPG